MKSMRKLKLSELMRQQVLDYLIENPGTPQPSVIDAMIELHKWERRGASSRMLDLVDHNEIRREPCVTRRVNVFGSPQPQRSFKCWALVEKTRSAEVVGRALGANLTKGARKTTPIDHTPVAKRDTGGRYINGVLRHTKFDRPVRRSPDAMHGSAQHLGKGMSVLVGGL